MASVKKQVADFEEFLREQKLDEFDNEEIARRLNVGKKFKIDGPILRRFRKKEALQPRTLWRVWLATDRKVSSLRPKVLTHLMEYMFENEMTPNQLSEKIGLTAGTLNSALYQNIASEMVAQKVFATIGLKLATGEVEKTSVAKAKRIFKQVETGNEFDLRLARVEARLGQVEDPTNTELVARFFEGMAEVARRATGIEKDSVGFDLDYPNRFDARNPGDTFEETLGALNSALNFFAQNEGPRKDLKGNFDPAFVLRLATGLASLIKEADFQVWLNSRVEL